MTDFYGSIEKELSQNLKEKIVGHRQRFKEIFKARYFELLPSLIRYKHGETVAVDWMKVEVALRGGYDVVIGETTKGNIQVIGYTKLKMTSTNPAHLFKTDHLKHGDITFIIPEYLRLQYYKEITNHDSASSGNFVVLRNKAVNYVSDYRIIEHYIEELSEIVLSRYSLSMQVKINTLFISEPNDETINQLISDIYNGSPYVKASKLFDPEEQIYHMQNQGIANNFQELKKEYQNKISELNNAIGIQSLAVEKESGVSDAEALSNRGLKSGIANIFLDGRNPGLQLLNKRYGKEIKAIYNDEVASEFRDIAKIAGDDNADTNTI